MNVSQVQIQNLTDTSSGELSDLFIRLCEFCLKKCSNNSKNYEICEKLSCTHEFFCEFCLRNAMQTRRKENTLIMTFKPIAAWYYHHNYLGNKRIIWLHDIKKYIEIHKRIGLSNPLFMYDEETMNWFVDFNRIGDDSKKVPLESVCETVETIVESFDLKKNIPTLDVDKFFSKYVNAINEFNQKRERPNGKRILCPTFSECLSSITKLPVEKIKNFLPDQMENKK